MKKITWAMLSTLSLLNSIPTLADQQKSQASNQIQQASEGIGYPETENGGFGLGGIGIGIGGGILGPTSNFPKEILSYPEKVSVKIKGSNKNEDCTFDSKLTLYYCTQGSQKIIVKNSGFGVSAFSFDEKQKKLKPIAIEEIVNGENILYREAKYPGSGSYGYPGFSEDRLNQNKSAQVQLPPNLTNPSYEASSEMNFLSMGVQPLLGKAFNNPFMKGVPKNEDLVGSDEFEKQFAGLRQFVTERKEKIVSAFQDPKIEIELSSGQKLSCDRKFAIRDLKPEEEPVFKSYQTTYNAKIQCGVAACEDVTIDGKKYTPLLMLDSNPHSGSRGDIKLIAKNGTQSSFGPSVEIKKVTSPKNDVVISDNSYFLKNKGKFYTDTYQTEMFKTLPKSLASKKDDILKVKDPNTESYIRFNSEYCLEPKELMENYFDAKKNFLADLANAEVAEYISVLQGGRLVGSFVSKEYAQKEGCLYQGVFVDLKSLEHLEKIKKNIHPDRHVATISMNRASELFKKAQKMDDIAWKYKPDGCYARAHLMARRFEEEGVRVDKVWIKGDLAVPEANIRWNFHVAPIVYVEDEKGLIKKMVIDPSLFDKPVTVEEWDAKMQKNTIKGSVVTAFPFPENSAFYERSTLSFSTSDPYLPMDSVHLSEDEKMNLANMTMQQYKELEPK